MKGIIVTIVASLGGALGWWLGAFEGTMTAFFLSIIGTAVGVYFARKLIVEFLP